MRSHPNCFELYQPFFLPPQEAFHTPNVMERLPTSWQQIPGPPRYTLAPHQTA